MRLKFQKNSSKKNIRQNTSIRTEPKIIKALSLVRLYISKGGPNDYTMKFDTYLLGLRDPCMYLLCSNNVYPAAPNGLVGDKFVFSQYCHSSPEFFVNISIYPIERKPKQKLACRLRRAVQACDCLELFLSDCFATYMQFFSRFPSNWICHAKFLPKSTVILQFYTLM